MDVILDTNILLGDVKFARTQFSELFAYLRRSNSRLVVPSVVLGELLERYEEKLTARLNTARGSWKELRQWCVSDPGDCPRIDIVGQVQTLRKKMQQPASGVTAFIQSDARNIDVDEIARRGIKRIRPANKNGEQLRDVILWLIVLQYARQEKRSVALISDDGDFRESDGSDYLHSDLVSEIEQQNLPVFFYRDVGKFVTSNSLSHRPIDESLLSKQIQQSALEGQIRQFLLSIRFTEGQPQKVEIDSVNFAKGVQYQISADSLYVEAEYRAKATVTVRKSWIPNNQFTVAPTRGYSVISNNMPFSSNQMIVPGMLSEDQVELTSNAAISSIASASFNVAASTSFNVAAFTPYMEVFDQTYDCILLLEVSARIANELVIDWQIDRLSLEQLTPKVVSG
jgi:hypothetical protein